MPLIPGKSKKAISKNIEIEMEHGKPQKQSIAIAYSMAKKKKPKKMADGGSVKPKEESKDSKEASSTPNRDAFFKGMRGAFGGKKAEGGMIDRESELDKPSIDDAITPEEMDMIHAYRRKKYYDGGQVLSADESGPYGKDMLDDESMSHAPERSFHDESMSGNSIDEASDSREMEMMKRPKSRFARGGEIDLRDESMSGNSIDAARTDRDEDMLDAKPRRHADEMRAAGSRPMADDSDDMELEMLSAKGQPDKFSKDGVINYAKGGKIDMHGMSIAEAIRHKKMMADGGEVDLQANADEDLNKEDQLSYEAARKKTYFDDSQIDEQPMDSNEHGDELSDADEHSMIGSIRRKIKSKRS